MASLSTLRRDAQPWARALFDAARDAGLNPRVSSARRGPVQQAYLYRMATRGATRFPAAKPGESLHQQGLAFDLVVTPMEALGKLGLLWESWGFYWGGRHNDPIHFEYRPKT